MAKLQALHASAPQSSVASSPRPPPPPLGAPAAARREHVYGGKRLELNVSQLVERGLIAPENQARKLVQEYRAIKRPLLTNARDGREQDVANANLLMVTSSIAGEGKSFTCLNLCLSVAQEQDWSVVLVDADCQRPALTQLFEATGQPGLVDLLRDPTRSFDSVVMPTSLPRFSFVPAGSRDEQAAELLASTRMEQLCAQLESEDPHRLIVFDAGPLLLAPEPMVLAPRVGQVVFVVRANMTSRDAVRMSLDKLGRNRIVNLVLNDVRRTLVPAYGDYPQKAAAE